MIQTLKLDSDYITKVSEWIYQNHPKIYTWGQDKIREVVDWYSQDRGLGIVRDNGKIVAVGLAKAVKWQDGPGDFWKRDESGDTIFVQEVMADKKEFVPILWQIMIQRFGKRQFVSMKRHGKLRKFLFEDYNRKMSLMKG